MKRVPSKGKISEKNGPIGNRKMVGSGGQKYTNQTEMSNNESEMGGRKQNGSLSKSTGKSRGNSNTKQHHMIAGLNEQINH